MAKKMLIDATHPEETRVVVVDGSRIEEFDYETVTKAQISGNIYLAKVTRVEPSLQAAFVEYGGSRHGFLAFAEIHPDYYTIPVADREALLAAERAAHRDEDFDEDEERGRRQERRNGRRASRGEARGKDEAGENGQDRRRRGRRRDSGRRRGLTLEPLSENGAPTADQVALANQGDRLDGPSRAALLTTAEANGGFGAFDAETETLAAKSNEIPDLSDVAEIEIHRSPTEEEAAEGRDVVVERIDLSAFAAPAAENDADPAQSRDSGAETPVAQEENAPHDTGPQDGAAQVVAEAVGAAPGVAVAAPPEEAAGENDGGESASPSSADEVDASSSKNDQDEAASAPAAGDDEEDDAESETAEIETLGEDDDDDADSRDDLQPRRVRLRDYRIQEVIKRRQVMLVQVVKEERGTKGAALTTYLSLAGRYCVLMPNTARGGGISRKITNAADRKRLKSVTQELEVPDGMGLIVRTAGANRTKAELKRDFEYLLRQWSAIRALTFESIAPALIYEEGSLVKRAIRDLYNKDIESVLVEGDEAYREAKDYMKMLMPSHAKHVQPYREPTPLFARQQVENQIGAMMNPTVPLKSGGYLVIGVTEALVAIDVNSGRSTKEGSIEDTALKTNLEAAEEAARQMRLRDLAGLIVIDFIDMEESKNNRAVEKRLKDRLKDDRARIQVGRISGFGLLEMSRQRLRPGLLEATTQPCPHCKGAGVVRSDESMALTILRAVEEEAGRRRSPALRVGAPVVVANYLMNRKRSRIGMIEERHGIQVNIEGDPTLVSPDFAVERVKPVAREEPTHRAIQLDAVYDDLDSIDDDDDDDAVTLEDAAADSGEEREERGRRRRKRGKDHDDAPGLSASDDAETEPDEAIEAAEDGDEDEPRKRRGRRGGRRRRRRGEDEPRVNGSGSDDGAAAAADDDRDDDADAPDPLPVFGSDDEDDALTNEVSALAETQNDAEDRDDLEGNAAFANGDRDGLAPLDGAEDGAEEDETAIDAPSQDQEISAAPDAISRQTDREAPQGDALAAGPAAAAAEDPRPRRTGWWSFGRSN